MAVLTLGELGDARAVEPLKELLGDKDAAVRTAAAEALKQLRKQSEP
jgi:HEAT repeat protein